MRPFRFENGQMPGSLELAYLGDTLYDLYVRSSLVRAGGKVRNLHAQAVKRVCAHAQAEAFSRVEPFLTQEEADVARRARNAHQIPARHANAREYHLATALEAVVGYLFVTNRHERMESILQIALEEDHEQQ